MAVRAAGRGLDLHALTSMIADANDDEPGPMLPWALLENLGRLIPAEEVSICDLDLEHTFDRVGVRTRGAAVAHLVPELRQPESSPGEVSATRCVAMHPTPAQARS